MDILEILKERIKTSNKVSVAEELGITVTHLNNCLSGRKKISKLMEYKLTSKEAETSNEVIVFELDKGSNMEKLISLLSEYDDTQALSVLQLLEK
jgi:plasmid maintenance system antidote protein VapI